MSNTPTNIFYTKTHEWIRKENDTEVTVGITDHAQAQLGELVFVELPELNKKFCIGDEAAVVESVKTASDVYAPLAGEITAINEALEASPHLVNEDPYGAGWLFKLKLTNSADFKKLLSADVYEAECA
ncbi:MAG: glycine cleavage system protein H [Gammaproteobacteria bacterium RIFCSPHIGHO2_12_FULL_41_15]|nr:MAG: glycine cleavage system protein H [Gammaproteobacteria bacterium RIFCSPHIGHO2_12_FULL_41_15]